MKSLSQSQLILASASPRRVELLAASGITPAGISPADIDEAPIKGEKPAILAVRLATEKAKTVHKDGFFTLGADTVVTCGQKLLGKPEDENEARKFLTLLSGRRHRVITGLCVITPAGKASTRAVTTIVKFKKLSPTEITAYLASGEWKGKAGGYGVQGLAGPFVAFISGSYTNVVGLPVYDTMQMLNGAGFKPLQGD